jgi:hypothetical protein
MKKKTILYVSLILIALFIMMPNVAADEFICEIFGDEFVIDQQLANITSTVILVIQVAVPVILIIFGMIDFAKAVMAQKEDDIKSGQKIFIKRLIAAALVFLVIIFVKLIIGWVAGEEGVMACVDCFINRNASC